MNASDAVTPEQVRIATGPRAATIMQVDAIQMAYFATAPHARITLRQATVAHSGSEHPTGMSDAEAHLAPDLVFDAVPAAARELQGL